MPELPSTVNPVWEAIENKKIKNEIRPYLGYSQLGHKCSRFLWYSFRWMFVDYITPRQKRLFSRGDQEEPIVVKDLQSAGVVCRDVLENQLGLVGFLGHVKGHPDGSATNVPGAEKTDHNLEIKTASDKRFTEMKRFGIEKSNPEYYVQANCYMGKKKQTRTLFVVTNKNTDERIYERIKYDQFVFEKAEERSCDIISSNIPPRRISENAEWYECKWCSAYSLCHQSTPYEKNCRTCFNAAIKAAGEWHCSVYKDSGAIPEHIQRVGCEASYKPFL